MQLFYAFIEDEFFRADYEAANFFVAGTSDYFLDNVVYSKCFWLSDEEMKEFTVTDQSKEADGKHTGEQEQEQDKERHLGCIYIDGSHVMRRIGPHKTILRKMESDEARVEALKEFFGIDVASGLSHIRGRGPAMKVKD